MKTMGLIGGMSWESTLIYFRLINEGVKARLGGHHSAKLVLYNVDFAEIETLQQAGRWEEAGEQLAAAARSLERAGAEFIVLCTNTMHIVASAIDQAVPLPFLHIADPTASAIHAAGLRTMGLLGTRFTMEQDFYLGRLHDRHDIVALVPEAEDRDTVHRVIYDELVHGKVSPESHEKYLAIIDRLRDRGAEGVIFGCTEISMLVSPGSIALPCFDTTELHAGAAVDFALDRPFALQVKGARSAQG